DGHPDFFAHLARLAFSEEKVDEAWEMALRGLRRIYERSARSSEWEDHEQDLGLLLRYLSDHLQDHPAPPEVVEALTELAGQLRVPEDHLDLGHCLRHLGETELAREELAVGLASDIDGENRDEGIRGLLTMQVEDFERRFVVAVDELALEPQPEHAIEEMQVFLGVQPEFWPALFFLAVGYKRLGDEDKALDTFAEALAVSPSQPEVLFEMGELFDRRGNPKRALECVEEALQSQPDEPKLSAAMARYCERLGRIDEARVAIASAIELDPDSVEYQALRDRLFTNDS
ncbi:MAG: tetratricopeptide repeat protein, partial [Planctomycetota bacterium]|nr:tetratricopeptide repeat protein [Planctomycetota bacterium]